MRPLRVVVAWIYPSLHSTSTMGHEYTPWILLTVAPRMSNKLRQNGTSALRKPLQPQRAVATVSSQLLHFPKSLTGCPVVQREFRQQVIQFACLAHCQMPYYVFLGYFMWALFQHVKDEPSWFFPPHGWHVWRQMRHQLGQIAPRADGTTPRDSYTATDWADPIAPFCSVPSLEWSGARTKITDQG